MNEAVTKSLPEGVQVVSDTALILPIGANLAPRYGGTTVSQAINAYMMAYQGRDATRAQRMDWWDAEIGHMRLDEVEQGSRHRSDLRERAHDDYQADDAGNGEVEGNFPQINGHGGERTRTTDAMTTPAPPARIPTSAVFPA